MATRNNTFILKRSNVVGKIPVLSGLTLGELALNTADAKLYTLYTGGLTGATEVREIGWNRLSVSGGTLYGNLNVLGNTTTSTLQVTSGASNGYVLTSDSLGNAYWSPLASSSANTVSIDPVLSIISTPPLSPNTGDRYLVFTGATSFFSGQTNNIAEWDGSNWSFYVPSTDNVVYVTNLLLTYRYDGSLVTTFKWALFGVSYAILQNGNIFNGPMFIGTNDNQIVNIKSSGETKMFISPSNGVTIGKNQSTNPSNVYLKVGGTDGQTDLTVGDGFITFGKIGATKQWGFSLNNVGTALTTLNATMYAGSQGQNTNPSHGLGTVINAVATTTRGTLDFTNRGGLNARFYPDSLSFTPLASDGNSIAGGSISTTRNSFIFVTPASINLNGGTELIGADFNFSNAIGHKGGDISLQRDFIIRPRRHNYNSASTITESYTMWIGGNPIIGTNANVLQNWALGVGGDITITGKTKTINFQMTSGATAGYILTSLDSNGNAYWAPNVTDTDNFVTGGTYSNGVLTLDRQNGSVTISGLLSADTYVTGFTYDNQNKLTLSQNQGQPDLIVYINQFSGLSINGLSLPSGYALSVTGDSIFNGDVYVNGDLNYNGNLIVTGSTIIQNGLTANTIYTDYIDFNTNPTGVTTQFGRINWDSGTGTLNIGIGDSTTGLIDFQVGQEEVVRVYNSEGTTLQKGEIVYVSGSQGNRPAVKRASAVSDGYSVTTLGMVDLAIPSGSEGYVTTFGIISNLNTLGLTGGTPIWLSPTTPGAYTSAKPIAPQHTVLIGYVVRVSATVGSIFVNISNGWELDELHDVRISGATEGDLIIRSSYSGTPVWVNSKTLKGNYTISGNTSQIGDFNITGNTVIDGSLSADTITIVNSPTLNNNLTQILGRNEVNGNVEYRQVNTIGNNYTYVSGSTYSATTTDNVIGVDTSISSVTIYLPDSISSGRLRYDIKDIGLNSFNNNIIIISQGSDTIISTENSNTIILSADGGALIIFNTGTGTWLQM